MSPPKSTEPEFTIHNAPPQPIKDGDDLDKIMQEVGTQLKKDDRHAPKRGLFSKNKTASHHKPTPAPLPEHASAAGQAPHPAAAAPPKPHAQNSTPVLVITVTIIVTGILIAAAISASK